MSVLKRIWEGWKAFGRFMGNQVARVALSIFYFTLFAPFGLGVRWRADPLHIKTIPGELWQPRSSTEQTTDQALVDAERQF
jgi:hypothetical protein